MTNKGCQKIEEGKFLPVRGGGLIYMLAPALSPRVEKVRHFPRGTGVAFVSFRNAATYRRAETKFALQ